MTKAGEIRRVLLITLFLNWLVALSKLVLGYRTAVLSMVADGYHSLLDGSSNLVGLVAIRYAYKPADADHQYGHRKYEALTAMAISLALFAAAWRILGDAVERIRGVSEPQVGPLNFLVMLATIAINVGVSGYEAREGRRLNSQILISDAAHTRSDVFASAAVIVSLIGARLGLVWLDLVAALSIAAIIVRIGYRIIMDNLVVISDSVAVEPLDIERLVRSLEGVKRVSRIRSRGTGDHVFMDLVCGVGGDMTLRDAHALADRIERRIQEFHPEVKDIVVHMEPVDE